MLVGIINLLLLDVNLFCYGEDVVLEYIFECVGDLECWNWFICLDVVFVYIVLFNNGDCNLLYYINCLYEDIWVKVEKINGICLVDEIEFFFDIIDLLMINSFIVDYSLICVLGFVDLEVDFDFLFVLVGCIYIIYWYKGINCIYIFIYISVMVMYIYMLLVGIGLAGNYYCIIESSCCL